MVSQRDYGLESAVYDLNLIGARVAREAADEYLSLIHISEPTRPY